MEEVNNPAHAFAQSSDSPLPAPLPGRIDSAGRVPGVALRFTPG